MSLLRIDSSARKTGSVSRALADKVEAALATGPVTHRDLSRDPLPQIDAHWAAARLVEPEARTPEQADALALSDALVDELKAADTIVISAPIYNFGIPASLKAWIDLVARPRVTFSYSEGGPVGHLTGKRAVLVMASGGVPIGSQMDYATPHLRHVLGFLGISDVTVVSSEDDIAGLTAPRAA